MEPKRWLNEHENPVIRRALRAGSELAPPPDAQEAAWAGLTAALAAGGAVAVASGTAGSVGFSLAKPASLSAVALAKLFGMSFGAGVLVMGTGAVVMRSPLFEEPSPPSMLGASSTRISAPSHREPIRTTPPAIAEPAPEPAQESSPTPRPTARALAPTEPALPPPAMAAGPSEESRIVLEAREALRRGDPERALSELERASRTFGSGALGQERLALEIDALLAAGDRDLAAERAVVFLQRYPESPHRARVRALVPTKD